MLDAVGATRIAEIGCVSILVLGVDLSESRLYFRRHRNKPFSHH